MADISSRRGHGYATPAILEHLANLHAPHDAALDRAFAAPGQHGLPAIQVSAEEGALLGWLLRGIEARAVVEVGTLAGYSAIHLARSLRQGGRLFTLELDAKHAAVARDNLAAAGLSGCAEVLEGDALRSLEGLEAQGPFDVVFLDADKGRYDLYLTWALAHLRPGGLLIADNVYFFGRLLDEHPDADAMRRFHAHAAANLDAVVVPTPDGLLLGRTRSQ